MSAPETFASEGFAAEDRIAEITLDDSAAAAPTPDLDQERRIALFDLSEANAFRPAGAAAPGPYAMTLRADPNGVRFEVRSAAEPNAEPLRFAPTQAPLDDAIRDYLAVCEGYRRAVRNLSPAQIEQADRDRKDCHTEGAEALRADLVGSAAMDAPTARRLFTLLCAVRAADL